ATVLAGQLRHRGYNVELDLELTPEALTDKMRTAPYSGLMLSASGLGHLENCRELVNCSKRASRNTPVIFGGTVLEQYQDLEFHTGADLVTLDVAEALDFCGLPDITMAHPANDHLPPSATTRSSQAGTPE
ncbi:MAG: cobalamin B12-binding domain-containing protein, partial [Pseudomonadota bacterium]